MKLADAIFICFVVLSLLEGFGRIFFWPVAYRIGIRIATESLPYTDDGVAFPDDAQTTHGRLRKCGDRVLMRRRWRLLVWRTTLGMTGSFRCEGDRCLVEMRLPLTTVAFAVVWPVLWTAVLVSAIYTGQTDLLALGLLVYLFPAVLWWLALASDRQELSLVVREYLGARLTSASS